MYHKDHIYGHYNSILGKESLKKVMPFGLILIQMEISMMQENRSGLLEPQIAPQ
jgi:hypothetical protein